MKHAALLLAVIQGLAASVACGDDSAAADAAVVIDARPDEGTLALAWTVADADQSPITCDDVAALTVGVSAILEGAGSGTPLAFPCGDGAGTAQLAPGTYALRIELRAGAGVLDGPIVSSGVEITRDQTTDLAPVTFEVPTTGGFSFLLDTPPLGSNCDEAEGDLTEITFELRDATDTCVPATFEIAAGAASSAGTYQADCTGAGFGCIDNDQMITVIDVDSGPHGLVMRGAKGGVADCYSRNAQIIIPGNDLVRNLPAQQLMLASTPACDPLAPDAGVMPDAGVTDAGLDAAL
jgi:hypothetical protein